MIKTPHETFVHGPAGRYCVTGSSFVWCASPSLAGAVLWAKQSEAETRHVLDVFDGSLLRMGASFDVILDTRGVDAVDPQPLEILLSWMVARLGELAHRIRLQACVIREGPIGMILTGLMPVTGQAQPYRLFTDPTEAFAVVAGDAGATLCTEVESIIERVRDIPREVRVTRELLETRIDIPFDEVSRALGMSPRSLQRALGRHGTTFHDEVVAARLALAKELLRSGDHKLHDVGVRVGISERALGLLFRAKTGMTPAAWRKLNRA